MALGLYNRGKTPSFLSTKLFDIYVSSSIQSYPKNRLQNDLANRPYNKDKKPHKNIW